MKTTPQSRGNACPYIAVAVFVCCACLPAYSQNMASTVVNLTIEPAAVITVAPKITMTTVKTNDPGSWIGHTLKSSGHVDVSLSTNYAGTLRCNRQISLVSGLNTLQPPVGASITLSGPSGHYFDPTFNYDCIDLDPGVYQAGVNGVVLEVDVTKEWSYLDIAGTYTGTVLLEFVQ